MTAQDPELSAALGWPGGTSDPVLDRKTLLQIVAALREAAQQALEALKFSTPNPRSIDDDYAEQGWKEHIAALAALRAALVQQAEPVQDQDVEDAIEAAYWQFDCRKKGLNEWASAPQSERDAFKAEARKLVRGYFPTRQAQDTKREMLAVADAFIRGKRAALAQQAEPVEPVAWKQGNLVTFNEDPCPVLGGLFVQFWDGEEVAARVYANDFKALRQRCAKVNTAPPQRKLVPLTAQELDGVIERHVGGSEITDDMYTSMEQFARAIEKASWEKNHGQA